MPLFPLPALFALAGWLAIFPGTPRPILGVRPGLPGLGVVAFAVWDWSGRDRDRDSAKDRCRSGDTDHATAKIGTVQSLTCL